MIVVGIDSASKRVDAVALKDGVYHAHYTLDIEKQAKKVGLDRGEQLTALSEDLTCWLREKTTFDEQPVLFIEDSIVRASGQTTRVLSQSVGMLLALPFPTRTAVVTEWKKHSVGKGNATKDEVRLTLAQRLGPSVADLFDGRQDLFDAAGVALYGDAVLRHQ